MHCPVIEHGMTSLSFQIAVQKNEAKLHNTSEDGDGEIQNDTSEEVQCT